MFEFVCIALFYIFFLYVSFHTSSFRLPYQIVTPKNEEPEILTKQLLPSRCSMEGL